MKKEKKRSQALKQTGAEPEPMAHASSALRKGELLRQSLKFGDQVTPTIEQEG